MFRRHDMILRASELRVKEAVSTTDGSRLGYIFDMEIDMDTGKVVSFIIPGGSRLLGFLGRGGEHWCRSRGSPRSELTWCWWMTPT